MEEGLKELFAGTGLIDLVICITMLEFFFFELWLRRTHRLQVLFDMRPMLISALWLMLGLRSMITGQHWLISAGFMTAAGLAHILDLRQRLMSVTD